MDSRATDEVRTAAEVQLARYTKRLGLYTFLLTLATVALVIFTAWMALSTRDLRDLSLQQGEDTKSLIELTRKATESATKQAEASALLAETAKAQAEISKSEADNIRRQADALLEQNKISLKQIDENIKSSTRQNQAYGHFLPYQTNLMQQDREFYPTTNAVGNFQNVGNTPMKNLRVWCISALVDFPFVDDVEPDLFPQNYHRDMARFASDGSHWEGGITIGPGKVHTFPITTLHLPWTDSEMKEYQNGEKVFYVEVVVWYKDAYGNRHKEADCVYFEHTHYFDAEWSNCLKRRAKL